MNRRELITAAGAACLVPPCEASALSRGQGLLATLRMGPAQKGAGNHRWASIESGRITGELLCGLALEGRIDWHVDPASGAVEVSLCCTVIDAAGTEWTLTDASCPGGTGTDPAGGLQSAPRLARASEPGRQHGVLEGRMDPRRFSQGWLELHINKRT